MLLVHRFNIKLLIKWFLEKIMNSSERFTNLVHQFFPWIFLNSSSWTRKQISYWYKTDLFSQFASWKKPNEITTRQKNLLILISRSVKLSNKFIKNLKKITGWVLKNTPKTFQFNSNSTQKFNFIVKFPKVNKQTNSLTNSIQDVWRSCSMWYEL